MAEPTHGEILAQFRELKAEFSAFAKQAAAESAALRADIAHMSETMTALKADNDEWKAIKAGAGIARWVLVTLIAGLAMIAGVFKTLAGGQG